MSWSWNTDATTSQPLICVTRKRLWNPDQEGRWGVGSGREMKSKLGIWRKEEWEFCICHLPSWSNWRPKKKISYMHLKRAQRFLSSPPAAAIPSLDTQMHFPIYVSHHVGHNCDTFWSLETRTIRSPFFKFLACEPSMRVSFVWLCKWQDLHQSHLCLDHCGYSR